jgi:DNA-directed RNA polymerase specialized sigma24 family protein|nr:MAG TPA: periplasmic protein [Caudoviricetes sp.]
MAEYNNQSIDIDLEEMFNGLSDEDQEEFLVDMFQNLSVEETRKNVVKDNIWYLDADSTIEIIEDAFNTLNSSSRQEAAERIADALTPEQREALVEYIKGE